MLSPKSTLRMRVRAALALAPLDGSGDLGGEVAVQCAVGPIEVEKDSFEETSCDDRVVWIQGGASHEAQRHLQRDPAIGHHWLVAPLSTMYRVPQQLRDDAALLANDMAAAIHIAKIVAAHQLKTLGIVASATTTPLAHLTVWCLQQARGADESDPDLHVVLLGEVSELVAKSWKEVSLVNVRASTDGAEALPLDGCIDLCGVDASLEFATRQLEPLGTLVLLAPHPLGSGPTRIDMNTVVVNELNMVNIGDFRGQLRDAVDVLVAHTDAFEHLVPLLVETGSVLRTPV